MELIEAMREHPLFCGLNEQEIQKILVCFRFTARHFRKDEYILMEGDEVTQVGWILEGSILMEKEDYRGQGYAYVKLERGELFGETFLGLQVQHSTVNYKALTDGSVLFFRNRSYWVTCEKICPCHLKFEENLTSLLAEKTRRLLAKIEVLSQKGMRERILVYLQQLLEKNHGKQPLVVPFHKTGLAEYLCVNRSAMERELTRMQQDGLLICEENKYTLMHLERVEL